MGMVGRDDGERIACDDCEAAVERIEDIRSVMPETFFLGGSCFLLLRRRRLEWKFWRENLEKADPQLINAMYH